MPNIYNVNAISDRLKGDPVSGWDCGVAVAQWLQDLLYSAQPKDKRPTLKLMFVGNPQEMKRPANKPDFFDFPQFKAKDLVSGSHGHYNHHIL